MRLLIDTAAREVVHEEADGQRAVLPLYGPEAFALLSRCWLTVGWSQKYSYGFTWLGRPIIQLPEDVVRVQEIVHRVNPDVIIETGVAHGGSLIFYASLCKARDRGRVVGIDVHIRPHNRAAIEAHPLAPYITLVEGDSTDPAVVARVRDLVGPGETVLVVLDSCHTRAHVLAELGAYAGLVTPGSYIVAADGIMADVADAPGGKPDWTWNNPRKAVQDFARGRADFVLEEPPWLFNEGTIAERVTYWPAAYLRRVA
jgi:cephalosporin hydroxylase